MNSALVNWDKWARQQTFISCLGTYKANELKCIPLLVCNLPRFFWPKIKRRFFSFPPKWVSVLLVVSALLLELSLKPLVKCNSTMVLRIWLLKQPTDVKHTALWIMIFWTSKREVNCFIRKAKHYIFQINVVTRVRFI